MHTFDEKQTQGYPSRLTRKRKSSQTTRKRRREREKQKRKRNLNPSFESLPRNRHAARKKTEKEKNIH